jgi:PAS domain S-box-containing protein
MLYEATILHEEKILSSLETGHGPDHPAEPQPRQGRSHPRAGEASAPMVEPGGAASDGANPWAENAPHAVVITEGPAHLLRRVNPAFCELMGVAAGDVLGRPYAGAFSEPLGQGPLTLLDRVHRSGEAVQDHEVERFRPNGDPVVWSYTAWPLADPSGASDGLVIEIRDRTEQTRSVRRIQQMAHEIRQINERLLGSALREQEWTEKAEAAARAKSDFLAMMSHELRTPLSGIVGYTEVLLGGMLGSVNEKQHEGLQRINTCSHHLLEMIEDVLAFAQVEANSLQVRCERIDVWRLAREAAAVIEPLAAEKGIELHVETRATPLTLDTDAHKVRQILLNLLGNAVKFTEAGEVRLEVEERDEGVRMVVRDTGIGIDPEELERVFEPFVQGESVMTRKFGGTGLGLAISRALAALLGGGVSARSTPGRGSTFWVDLPRATPRL